MRNGSPVTPQCGQTKPSPQRDLSRYSEQAASFGKSRWNSGSDCGNGSAACWSMSIRIGVGASIPASPFQTIKSRASAQNASALSPYSWTNSTPGGCMCQPDRQGFNELDDDFSKYAMLDASECTG